MIVNGSVYRGRKLSENVNRDRSMLGTLFGGFEGSLHIPVIFELPMSDISKPRLQDETMAVLFCEAFWT